MPGRRQLAASRPVLSASSGSDQQQREQQEDQQPYYLQETYLPPSPPKSRSTTPDGGHHQVPRFRGAVAGGAGTGSNTNSMASMTATQTQMHVLDQAPPTQHWNDLPAGLVASTAIQRKGSQPSSSAAGEPQSASITTSSKYPPAPLRSPLAGSFGQSQNGYHHHDAVKDTQMGGNAGMNGNNDYHNGYANGYGRSTSPLLATEGAASSTLGSLYNRASDAVKLSSSTSRSLPTHQSSSAPTSGHHARRKSIAQAVVPSISTVRFVTLCALWYTSSAVSNNTGKSILNSFRYPVTLTFIQFGFVAGWCIIFCVGRTKLAQFQQAKSSLSQQTGSHSRSMSISQMYSSTWGIKKPTRKALEGTVVMSVFQIAGHIFSSMATARIPVSTVHTIKVSPFIRDCVD